MEYITSIKSFNGVVNEAGIMKCAREVVEELKLYLKLPEDLRLEASHGWLHKFKIKYDLKSWQRMG